MPVGLNDYRIVAFGSGGVGKTSLVHRFVRNTFHDAYIPTIEDTYRQVIMCNNHAFTLQITDTTGSHQFPAMRRLSISRGHAFLLVYSITHRASFMSLLPLYNDLKSIRGAELHSMPLILVGNKCDETDLREVSTEEGAALSRLWNCAFIETSAKANCNVKEMFQELLQLESRSLIDWAKFTRRSKDRKYHQCCALL